MDYEGGSTAKGVEPLFRLHASLSGQRLGRYEGLNWRDRPVLLKELLDFEQAVRAASAGLCMRAAILGMALTQAEQDLMMRQQFEK